MSIKFIISQRALLQAFFKVKKNKGCAGIDNITINDFERHLDFNLLMLTNEIEQFEYTPRPFKSYSIRKDNGKTRRLAIPSIRDRVLQSSIADFLLPKFEQEFEKCSFGYRPNRSYKDAVQSVIEGYEKGYHFVIDADLDSYFDRIPQRRLLLMLEEKVLNPDISALISLTLFRQQSSNKRLSFGVSKGFGIPQGSPLSPILANFYLDGFDEMILSHDCHYVRYADDFVILTKTQNQADKILKKVKSSLTFLSLQLNEQKTQITTFENGFKFLGHQFIDNMVIEEKLQINFMPPEKLGTHIPNNLHATEQKFAVKNTFTPNDKMPELKNLWGEKDTNANQQSVYKLTTEPKLKTVYITQQGCVLQKRKGKLVISHKGTPIKEVPLQTIDMILILGRSQLTTDCYTFCLQHTIPIFFMSVTGALYGELSSAPALDATLLTQQLKYFDNVENSLVLTKRIVNAKIQNTFIVCKRLTAINKLKSTLQWQSLKEQAHVFQSTITQTDDINKIRGLEGAFAKSYFNILKLIIDEQWQFTNRNRRPPQDPVNVLLSLGYTILYANVHTLIATRGLLVSKGFLHTSEQKKPALALDLIEPLRAPLIDSVVLNLVLNGGIKLTHFQFNGQECTLTNEGRKLFLERLERKFTSQIQHPLEEGRTDYRRLVDIHIKWLKRDIINNTNDYKPLKIR